LFCFFYIRALNWNCK